MSPQEQKQMQDLQAQVIQLQAQLSDLSANFYKNNFSAYQAFNKASVFSTRLQIPVYTTLPSCEIGDICISGGKLQACIATKNVWVAQT